jgi:triacylglycerol lipase
MARNPISGLHRELGGLAHLLIPAAVRRDGLPPGGRRPVLIVPGLAATDLSTCVLTGRLRDLGYAAASARVGLNVDCGEETTTRLLERVAAMACACGQRVALVGHSHGGHLARVAAVRRPDLVCGIVTIGTSALRLSSVHPAVGAVAVALGLAGSAGVPGTLKLSCLRERGCCERYQSDHRARFPKEVGFVSIWSRRDAIVDWREIGERDARRVEVHASHVGMLTDPETFVAIANGLASFAPGCHPSSAAGDSAARAA